MQLPFERRDVAKRAVKPGGVVVLDPGGDRVARLVARLEAKARDELAFQRGPERFGRAVVVARSDAADRLEDAEAVTVRPEILREVLTAAVVINPNSG